MAALDHLVWAAPDLDEGTRLLGALCGVAPARGGSHPGFGTRNSLLGLGGETYLEIMSPDPAQPLSRNRGGSIARLPAPMLLTFVIRETDLAALTRRAEAAGLATRGPLPMSRTRPDGVKLAWTILEYDGHAFGDLVPFAVDWGTTPHPAPGMPAGCSLLSFEALTPEPETLARLYAALEIPVTVSRADAPGLLARLSTPRGEVVLAARAGEPIAAR